MQRLQERQPPSNRLQVGSHRSPRDSPAGHPQERMCVPSLPVPCPCPAPGRCQRRAPRPPQDGRGQVQGGGAGRFRSGRSPGDGTEADLMANTGMCWTQQNVPRRTPCRNRRDRPRSSGPWDPGPVQPAECALSHKAQVRRHLRGPGAYVSSFAFWGRDRPYIPEGGKGPSRCGF